LLLLSLGGCVAAPLVQLAATQMSAGKPVCSGCTADAASSVLGDLSKSVSESYHKLTADAPAGQKVSGVNPTRTMDKG
jgi:hypothetical protein